MTVVHLELSAFMRAGVPGTGPTPAAGRELLKQKILAPMTHRCG